MIIQKLETLVNKPFDEWGGLKIVLTDIEVFYQTYENNVEEITPGTIYFDGKAIPCGGLIRNHMFFFGNSRLRNDSLSRNKLIEVYFGTMAPQKLPLDVTRQGAEIIRDYETDRGVIFTLGENVIIRINFKSTVTRFTPVTIQTNYAFSIFGFSNYT